jgi:hypothetical protein
MAGFWDFTFYFSTSSMVREHWFTDKRSANSHSTSKCQYRVGTLHLSSILSRRGCSHQPPHTLYRGYEVHGTRIMKFCLCSTAPLPPAGVGAAIATAQHSKRAAFRRQALAVGDRARTVSIRHSRRPRLRCRRLCRRQCGYSLRRLYRCPPPRHRRHSKETRCDRCINGAEEWWCSCTASSSCTI